VLQTYEKSLSLYIFKIRTHRALPHSFIMEAVSLGCGSFDVTEYRKIGVHYTWSSLCLKTAICAKKGVIKIGSPAFLLSFEVALIQLQSHYLLLIANLGIWAELVRLKRRLSVFFSFFYCSVVVRLILSIRTHRQALLKTSNWPLLAPRCLFALKYRADQGPATFFTLRTGFSLALFSGPALK